MAAKPPANSGPEEAKPHMQGYMQMFGEMKPAVKLVPPEIEEVEEKEEVERPDQPPVKAIGVRK